MNDTNMNGEYEKRLAESKYKREAPFFTQVNFVNYHEIKIEAPLPIKERVFEEKNLVGILWDELELFLKDDEDFKIERIEENTITIKTLRKEAFNNIFVMSKIFGRLLPFNCKLILRVREYRAPDPTNDLLIYDFNIKSDYNNFYDGNILIKK